MAKNHNNIVLCNSCNVARAKDARFLAVAMSGYLLGTGNSLKLLVAADRSSDNEIITHGKLLQVFIYTVPSAIRPAIKPVPTNPLPQNLVEKNTPGAKVTNDSTLDTGVAKSGAPDKSNYKFKIDFEKPYYDWLEDHPEPFWDSAQSITKLNQWCSQIFKRYFGVKRKPRDHWTVSEKKLVVKLMKKDLEKRSIVRWKRLANNYNKIMQGKVQDVEEAKVSKLVSKSDKLGEERSAPRTISAIKIQTSKWEGTKDLEEAPRASETSEVESTDDEKEIHDPKTDHEKINALNKKQIEKKGKGKGKAKGKNIAQGKREAKIKAKGKRTRQAAPPLDD
ncbi:hypothetical protein IFR05_014122 [Cadophora sp. M221]|nr:hypothetical protein IFR05_014122 [Cadophora sp. M221]